MDVLRAMSFGVLASDDHRGRDHRDSSDGGGGASSRSSSKNRFSKQLSRESTLELDDSLGLERSLSRLSLVSSHSAARPGTGILIKSRPSSPQPPATRSLSYESEPAPFLSTSVGSATSAGSSTDGTRPSRPLAPIRTHSATSSAASINEPLTPASVGFTPATTATATTTTTTTRDESVERSKPKIKFAPLPQIRPRSYSTGRNVWAERDDDDFHLGGDRVGWDETAVGGEEIDDDGSREHGRPFSGRHLVRREDRGAAGRGGTRRVHPSERESYEGGGHYGESDGYDSLERDDEEEEDDDDHHHDDTRGFNPRRQSWTDTLGMGSVWGLNSNGGGSGNRRDKSRESVDDDSVSLASGNGSDFGLSSSGGREKESLGGKILKPFLFGRRKSTTSKPSRPTTSGAGDVLGGAGGGGGGSLSRTSSRNDSPISSPNDTPGPPTPTNQGSRPKGTTGIPMRKASTWDSTNSAGSKGSNSTMKTSKPKHHSRSSLSAAAASTSLPRDPTTTPQIIYYASPSRSAGRPARRAQYPPVAQRSRTAPKPIRQTRVEEPEFSEWGSVGSVGSVQSRGSAKSNADDDEDGSGMAWIRRRRKEREEKEKRDRDLALSQAPDEPTTSGGGGDGGGPHDSETNPIAAEEDADKENEVVQRAIGRNPKRQSTVDSTFSMTSSTSTIRPASPKIMSGLSLSRPVEAEKDTDGRASPQGGSEEEEEEDGVGDRASEDEGSADEEDEEADNGAQEEDEDDLDAEELEREEALADAARRSAKGAGAERYHSTTHESVLHVPTSDSIIRQPSQQ